MSNLATMLGSGIPILEAVDTQLEDAKGSTKALLTLFRTSLNDGRPLSHAMAQAPRVFDPVTINLIKAAEEAGTLEDSLRDLVKALKKDMSFNDKIRSAMTYPIFIFIVFIGILGVILGFVIPRVSKVFTGLRVDLPAPTKFMIWLSDAVMTNYMYIIAGAIILVVLIVVLFKAKKRAFLSLILRLPILRGLGRDIDLTRFTRSMALLLKSGIPVSEALDLSQQTVTKKEIYEAVETMKIGVTAGKPISAGLHVSKKVVPSMMIHIVQTAEMSGTLEHTMQDLADYFEEQVEKSVRTLTTLIEPAMMVVMGLLVGAMMLAVIAPIYNIISQIAGR